MSINTGPLMVLYAKPQLFMYLTRPLHHNHEDIILD